VGLGSGVLGAVGTEILKGSLEIARVSGGRSSGMWRCDEEVRAWRFDAGIWSCDALEETCWFDEVAVILSRGESVVFGGLSDSCRGSREMGISSD